MAGFFGEGIIQAGVMVCVRERRVNIVVGKTLIIIDWLTQTEWHLRDHKIN